MREIYTSKESSRMRHKIKALLGNHFCNSGAEMIKVCNRVLLELYPGLKIRWARIYGFRWSYLFGNNEEISINIVRVKLNEKYGICIDNAEILSRAEIKEITTTLKECFTCGDDLQR